MRYLRKIYNYGADGNYVAPGKAWDATPRVVLPTDAQMNAGAVPDTAIPAEYENGRFKIVSDGHAVQLHDALHRWGVMSIPQIGTDQYRFLTSLRTTRSYGFNQDSQRRVVAIGQDAGASNKVRQAFCCDGTESESTPTRLDGIAAFQGPTWGVAGAPGELVLVNNSAIFAYSSNLGFSWATQSFSGPPTVYDAHYVPSGGASGYYLIANRQCFRAGTLATLISGPSVSSLPTPGSSNFVANQVEMCDSGSILVVGGTTSAGACSLYRSTDSGATWTLTQVGPDSGKVNVCWSEYYQLFFAWFDIGVLEYSSDGLTWTFVRSGIDTTKGFNAGRSTLLAVGPALVKPTDYTSFGTDAGIAYSLDQGVTWNYHYFATSSIVGLRALNGRVYAITANGRVYRSGLLGSPISEF